MHKISKTLSAAAIAGCAALAMQPAQAWWGGGPGGWGNDWLGDGGGDFNMSMSGRGNSYGRGYGYRDYYPYYGGYGAPYGYGYGAPYGYRAPYGGYPYGAPMAPPAPQAPAAK